jgi:hypothetical protein
MPLALEALRWSHAAGGRQRRRRFQTTTGHLVATIERSIGRLTSTH